MPPREQGGKLVYVSTSQNKRDRVLMEIPASPLPFGVSPYTDSVSGEIQSYSIDIAFRNHDTDPRVADFLAKMRQLDECLVEQATANSAAWLGKTMSKDLVAEHFYRKLVREAPENTNYAPTMKLKVPFDTFTAKPVTHFFDEQRQPVTVDYLTKGTVVKAIVELSSVWFVNKAFGCTWRVMQCAVVSKPNAIGGSWAFSDADADQPAGLGPAPAFLGENGHASAANGHANGHANGMETTGGEDGEDGVEI